MELTDHAVPRLEDTRMMTVGGRYTDDIAAPGAVHVVLVRSPVAYGRLRGVDVAAARRAPGVLDVVTAAELDCPPVPPHPPVLCQQMPQPLLAGGVVLKGAPGLARAGRWLALLLLAMYLRKFAGATPHAAVEALIYLVPLVGGALLLALSAKPWHELKAA